MLTINQPNKELGQVKYGKPYPFTYELSNTSNEVITINKIIVGCGSCTTAKTNKTTLSPGETSIIDVVFTPGSVGKQNKNINVKWNIDQLLKLTFTGESYE